MQGCCICRAESEVGRDVGVNDHVDGASFVGGEKVLGMREIVPFIPLGESRSQQPVRSLNTTGDWSILSVRSGRAPFSEQGVELGHRCAQPLFHPW